MATKIFKDEHFETYPRLDPANLRDEFAGKTVLVTGGGYGLGAGFARAFAEAGVSTIIITGRSEGPLKSTASELERSFEGLKVRTFVADVTKHDQVASVFAGLGDDESPDVLVNNAGYLSDLEVFPEINVAEWWKSFEINVLGPVLVTREHLLHRRRVAARTKAKLDAAVVLTVNTGAAFEFPMRSCSSYGASKSAASRWSEIMAVDVDPAEARFVSMHPGAVKTAMYWKSGFDGHIPVTDGRLSSEFAVWLASREAEFLNGRFVWVNWDVDGLIAKKEEIVGKNLLIAKLDS